MQSDPYLNKILERFSNNESHTAPVFATMMDVGWTKYHDKKIKVSQKEFDTFCKEYIISALKEEKFSVSFCKKFGILDFILLLKSTPNEAREYIQKTYIK